MYPLLANSLCLKQYRSDDIADVVVDFYFYRCNGCTLQSAYCTTTNFIWLQYFRCYSATCCNCSDVNSNRKLTSVCYERMYVLCGRLSYSRQIKEIAVTVSLSVLTYAHTLPLCARLCMFWFFRSPSSFFHFLASPERVNEWVACPCTERVVVYLCQCRLYDDDTLIFSHALFICGGGCECAIDRMDYFVRSRICVISIHLQNMYIIKIGCACGVWGQRWSKPYTVAISLFSEICNGIADRKIDSVRLLMMNMICLCIHTDRDYTNNVLCHSPDIGNDRNTHFSIEISFASFRSGIFWRQTNRNTACDKWRSISQRWWIVVGRRCLESAL